MTRIIAAALRNKVLNDCKFLHKLGKKQPSGTNATMFPTKFINALGIKYILSYISAHKCTRESF